MSALDLSRWVSAGLFGVGFVIIATVNTWVILILPRRLLDGERGPSPIPFIGGFFGAISCALAPLEVVRWFAWLPLVLDPGCLLFACYAVRAIRREADQALTQAEGPESQALRRAATGCLLGTAVGDALGLAGEGMSRRRLARVFPDISRYHLIGRAGFCSDDTEHACMTAQAFLAAQRNASSPCAEVFGASLASSLRWWLAGLPAGIGLATARAIFKLWLGWPPDKSGVRSAGNGPAMRAPILGVLLGRQMSQLHDFVRVSTRLTHTDPRAEQGALAVAVAAHLSVRTGTGGSFDPRSLTREIVDQLDPAATELRDLIIRAGESAAQGETTRDFAVAIGCANGVSGYMLHTVPVALHAWLAQPDNLAAALAAAIRCGGDTDSVAAIVGGLVGARVGREGIPPRLLTDLWEWPRSVRWMERLGAMLGATRTAGVAAFPIGLNVPGVIARNGLFLCVVLLHGMRRLLPPY